MFFDRGRGARLAKHDTLPTIMGGLGSHPHHPYLVQSLAFVISLLVPGGVFALLAGAWFEERRRRHGRRAAEALAAWRMVDGLLADEGAV